MPARSKEEELAHRRLGKAPRGVPRTRRLIGRAAQDAGEPNDHGSFAALTEIYALVVKSLILTSEVVPKLAQNHI